jgi:hypothetical protein
MKIRGTNTCGKGEFSGVIELTVDNFYRKMLYFQKLDEYAKRLLPPAAYAVLLRTELEFPPISALTQPDYIPTNNRYIVPWEERGEGWWYQGQRLQNGVRQGNGVEINSNGEDYGFIAIGHYMNDDMIGDFLCIYYDGEIGRGEFKGRKQIGRWTFEMRDGTTYTRTYNS